MLCWPVTLFERLSDQAKPVRSKMRAIVDEEQAAEHEAERQAGWDRVAEGRHALHNTGNGYRNKDAQKVELTRAMQSNGKTFREIADKFGKN